METISEDEYKLIKRNNCRYKSPKYGLIDDENAFIGKLDFDNESTISYINSLTLTNDLGFKMYSGFNFENAEIKTEDGKLKWYDTWNNIKIMKYKYCQIGKPKYVIIFQAYRR